MAVNVVVTIGKSIASMTKVISVTSIANVSVAIVPVDVDCMAIAMIIIAETIAVAITFKNTLCCIKITDFVALFFILLSRYWSQQSAQNKDLDQIFKK